MNLLVIDYTGESTQWLANFCKKEINILHIVTPGEQYWSKFIEARDYDAILIFESGKRELFIAMAELFNIPDERIIYATDIHSWISNSWAAYTLLNEKCHIFKATDYFMERYKRKYSVCTVEELSYIGYSTDTAIMLDMYQSGNNWSKMDMVIFKGLASNFYDLSGRKYFLDLGANIGTTSIYFKQKVDHDVKILAFEPDPETYKLLRANFILNEMPEDSILENYGLADKECEMILHRSSNNPGANSVFMCQKSHLNHDNGEVSIHLLALDDYLMSRNINMNEIKYIWIDTEGFEAQVFFGMQKLISTQNVPIVLEWNPDSYVSAGTFDYFVNMIVDNFENYVDIREVKVGNTSMHKTTDLWKFKDSTEQSDIFLIK